MKQNSNKPLQNTSAARLVASVFGILAGIGGLIRGIEEVLQGNVASTGLFIPSCTQGPIATTWAVSQA